MFPRYSVLPLLLAVAVLISCAGGTGISSNSSAPTASLNASSTSVNFGNVSVGSSKTVTLTLNNSSSSDVGVVISSLTVSGSGFSIVSPPTLPAVVSPGSSVTLSLRFAPTSAAAASGTLTVASDASDPSVSVALSGTGTATTVGLTVSPPTLSFGSVNLGSSKTMNGTLTASGSSVTVSSANWNGQGYAVSGISFPTTIAAGGTKSFSVTFAPQVAGSTPGSVSFVSNAPNSPTNETFSGTGTQAGQHSVTLSWTASTSSVAGYNLYRGTVSGGPYNKLNSSPQPGTSYTDATVVSGTTYFYVATAVDSSGNESAFSNQVGVPVP